MARPQRTIAQEAELSGTALFSGRPAAVRLRPAETSTGVLFVRTDLPDSPVVPATTEALGEGFRCTVLNWNNVEVRAVEHMLSACAGLHVDNLIVEMDGEEMPALGGCAADYARSLQDAGIVDQNAERPQLKLEQTVAIPQGHATIVAMPNEEGLTVSYVLDFDKGYGLTEASPVTHSRASMFLSQNASSTVSFSPIISPIVNYHSFNFISSLLLEIYNGCLTCDILVYPKQYRLLLSRIIFNTS